MKDYFLNYNKCNDYILFYRVKNRNIIIKLLNGKVQKIPYSKENEKAVISKMEKQARDIQLKPFKTSDMAIAIIDPLMIPVGVMNFMNNANWFNGIILAIILAGSIDYSSQAILNALEKREVKKLNYFLDHKKELNECIRKSKVANLKLSKKILEETERQERKNRQPININNIDNYSLSDLKLLKANIEKISSLEFEDAQLSEEKGAVLKKKMNYKRK